MRKIQIAVIGGANYKYDSNQYDSARLIGKKLVELGYRVVTGGFGGVMEAALKGAKESSYYQSGDTIGIVPGFDPKDANEFADIVISTGLDIYRNIIVANSDAIIVVGGGAGTLSEASHAWTLKRPIFVLEEMDGILNKIKIEKFDNRQHYDFDNKIVYFKEIDSLKYILDEGIKMYNKRHKSIRRIK